MRNAEGSMVSDGYGGYTLFNNVYPLNEICASNDRAWSI